MNRRNKIPPYVKNKMKSINYQLKILKRLKIKYKIVRFTFFFKSFFSLIYLNIVLFFAQIVLFFKKNIQKNIQKNKKKH